MMTKNTPAKRSRRLRKKLFLGEFAVLGFAATGQCAEGAGQITDKFIDDFIALIESRNLLIGGGFDKNTFDVFICPAARYASATQEDRIAVEHWLAAQGFMQQIEVGPLVDAYYGD